MVQLLDQKDFHLHKSYIIMNGEKN